MTTPTIAPAMDGSYAASRMPSAAHSSPLRHALLPTSLVVCFVLVYVLRVGAPWILAVALPSMALYLWAPRWGRRSRDAFDRDAARMMVRGEGAGLLARYGRAWGMRLFAPPGESAERRGKAEAQRGAHRRAAAAYRRALDGYPEGAAPVTVELGLAHASYAVGADHEAIRGYRAVLRSGTAFPLVALHLAHALARRGEDLDEAAALAERALQESADAGKPKAELVEALVEAKRGRRKAARRVLRRTRDESGLTQLREEVETALA